MTFLQAVIVDDEPLARSRLKRLLGNVEQVEVLAEGENGEQALELVRQYQPELLFLDIQMPVKNGLQAANEILQLEKSPAIIFCTAYDQYAIQAFKAQAAAYLLKPIMLEDVLQAINQASQLSQLQLNHLLDAQAPMPMLNIQHQDYIERKPLQEVSYFRSEGKHVVAGSVDGAEVIIDYTLKTLEERFPNELIRVHRNALVNRAYLLKLQRDAGQVSVVLQDNRQFAVSRRHLSEVKQCFI